MRQSALREKATQFIQIRVTEAEKLAIKQLANSKPGGVTGLIKEHLLGKSAFRR